MLPNYNATFPQQKVSGSVKRKADWMLTLGY